MILLRLRAEHLEPGDVIPHRGELRTVARVVPVMIFNGIQLATVTVWFTEPHPDGRGADGTAFYGWDLVPVEGLTLPDDEWLTVPTHTERGHDMPETRPYVVTIYETTSYDVTVEATDPEHASEEAFAVFNGCDDHDRHNLVTSRGADVVGVEVLERCGACQTLDHDTCPGVYGCACCADSMREVQA